MTDPKLEIIPQEILRRVNGDFYAHYEGNACRYR